MAVQEGDLLWTPGQEFARSSQIALFMDWLRQHKGLDFADYGTLWQWSVDCIEDFWAALWSYFEIDSSTPYDCVLQQRVMPGAVWFPGARVNFAKHVLRKGRRGRGERRRAREGAREQGDHESARNPAACDPELGGLSRSGRDAGRGASELGHPSRGPGRIHLAEYARSSHRVAGDDGDRGDLVGLFT